MSAEPILTVKNLRCTIAGQQVVEDVSFEVPATGITAVLGRNGVGKTSSLRGILGLISRRGEVRLAGERIDGLPTHRIVRRGVGYVPEDRSVDGLVKEFSVAENLVLDLYDRAPYGNGFKLNPGAISSGARERVEQFDIRTSSPHATVGTLSGGNQQKVVVAREMSRPLRLLIASQPTRGVDVGSIEFIHKRIVETRDAGIPVVVVSTELDEVAALADRIAVMYRGAIVGIVPGDTPRDVLGLMMAGEKPEEAVA